MRRKNLDLRKYTFIYIYLYIYVNQAFLSPATASKKLFLRLKNSSFEASKTIIFDTVFESQKSLFYFCVYGVLSDFDFCSSLKSSYKVANKELTSLFFELFWWSKRGVIESHKKLFGSCCWIPKKRDLHVYIYANQSLCVSQTDLKTFVCESQKEMFLSPKKAWKNITF